MVSSLLKTLMLDASTQTHKGAQDEDDSTNMVKEKKDKNRL